MLKEKAIAIRYLKVDLLGVAFILLNLIVKGVYLSSNSLAGDEPFSVYHAQMNIASIVTLLSQGNNPPLYEIILHYWIKIFGVTEFAVRFPSLLLNSVSAFFIYRIAAEHISKSVAFIAGFVFTFSNYFISFAHEARVYALLGLLTSVSMYLFVKILSDNTNHPDQVPSAINLNIKFVFLGVINALIIYAHYFGFFVLAVQFIFVVINQNFIKKSWRILIIIFGTTFFLFLPNIGVFIKRFAESSGGTWVQPPNGIESIYNMLWAFSNKPLTAVLVIAVSVTSIIQYFIRKRNEKKNIVIEFVVFWFCFIFFVMFAVSFWLPMFLDRYLMPAAIAFPFIVGISTVYVSKNLKYGFVLIVLVVFAFIATSNPNISNGRNVKDVVLKIKELKTLNSIVYFCPDWFDLNFAYYYNINYFKDYDSVAIKSKIHQHLQAENIFPISNYSQININLCKEKDKIIYLDAAADFSYPNNDIEKVLNENFKKNSVYHFADIFHIVEYKTN